MCRDFNRKAIVGIDTWSQKADEVLGLKLKWKYALGKKKIAPITLYTPQYLLKNQNTAQFGYGPNFFQLGGQYYCC